MMYRVVETDNFGGDYPDEKFVDIPPLNQHYATVVAAALNHGQETNSPRYYKVVDTDYLLMPGFEP